MILRWLSVCVFMLSPVAAFGFEKVQDKDSLLSALEGRALTMGLFRLSLQVSDDGQITGTAMGWGISGEWTWEDGLFCRELDWSGMAIAPDCQLVEQNGDKMRFTSDEGKGRSATFTLR